MKSLDTIAVTPTITCKK